VLRIERPEHRRALDGYEEHEGEVRATIAMDAWEERLLFRLFPERSALVVVREIGNTGTQPLAGAHPDWLLCDTDGKPDLLGKLLAHLDRGHKVRGLDERAFTGEPLPEILKVEYPEDSLNGRRGVRAHIAFFNWQDRERSVGGTREFLGIPPESAVTDYWTDKELANAAVVEAFLPPRSAQLMEIKEWR